jgi:adenylate cyclase
LYSSPVLDGLHTFHAVRGDGAQQWEVHHALGCMELKRGSLVDARAHLERAVALYDSAPAADAFRHSGHDPKACALSHLAHTLWLLGHPDQALQRARQAVAWAEQLENAFSRALAQTSLSLVHLLRREAGAARAVAEAALALAEEQGCPHFAALAIMLRGWAVTVQGEADDGLEQLRHGLSVCEAIGVGRTEYLVLFADACLRSGRPDAAGAVLDEAEHAVAVGGEHYLDAELLRLRAALTAEPSDAGELLRAARRRAAGQSAGGLDLRIACQLAAWHRAHGQVAEARVILAPLIDGLTEGRDTGDVVEARTLYAALAPRRRRRTG